MTKQSISDKQRTWLASQVTAWHTEGLITREQVEKILGLYETQADEAERKHSIVLISLMGIAAIFMMLGVLLLIGYNWAAMPASLKITIILALITGVHAAGLFARVKRNARLLSEVLFFFGCLLYGCGIFLITQIFNFNAHYPDAVWWWALGVLPFALCLDTFLTHFLLITLLGVWYGMEVIGFGRIGFDFWGEIGFVPRGIYSLPLLAFPGLGWAYHNRSITTVSLYAVLLAWWAILLPLPFRMEAESVYFIGAVGGLFLVCAECHRPGSYYAIPYRLLGVLISGGTLFLLSFYQLAQELTRAKVDANFLSHLVSIVAIAILLIGATIWLSSQKANDMQVNGHRIGQLLRRLYLPAAVILAMFFLFYWQVWAGDALLSTILANVILICLAFWLLKIGLRENRLRPFASGVIMLLAWSLARYIDLFGDFGGMLGAALMFFLCGGLLFGLAHFWRRRKELSNVN